MKVPAQTFISLTMQLKNPRSSGQSESLFIQTFKPDGLTIIDQDSSLANTNVSTTTAPSITITYTGSAVAGGTSITVNIQLIPNTGIPAQGYISFNIPSGFSTSSLVCSLTPYGSGTDFAKSCIVSGNTL